MKGRKKKESTPADETVFEASEGSFSELLGAILEDIQNKIKLESDPYDSYVKQVHARFHADSSTFHTRFVKGYAILLEELKNDQDLSEKATS